MKAILVLLLLLVAMPAHAWVVTADPYVPAANGSVGIPVDFVCKIDGGADIISAAIAPPANYDIPAPTGGWPAGTKVLWLNVDTYRGNHTLTCKARNAEGESAMTAPFAFTVPVAPAAPGVLRLKQLQ